MTLVQVWSPAAEDVALLHDGVRTSARAVADGWWEAEAPLGHGDRYAWSVDGADPLPDPRSVWLPDGVHEATAHYDHGLFAWTDAGWRGRPWDAAVVYELHAGTFSPSGTFDGVVERLDHLVGLGATHLELMPVASWDGPRGWGYDGVAPWSVQESYGGPDGLKRLVDACHARGLAVLLDVVHNHLGPSGNYLSRFGPYFTDTHHTPWGAAVNLDAPGSDGVRDWILSSVRSWLRDFHLDGLRLDAVHELRDDRAVHLLEAMSAVADELSAELDRPLVLVAESDRNDQRTVLPREASGLGVHAQWDDDVHHALHALLTGEEQGYYADFAVDPVAALAKVLTRGFFHDGTWSSFRGRHHGRRVDRDVVPGSRLVAALQTHDQVGNRAQGERLSGLCPPGLLACGAALLLTSPFTPMLFMGEEWGASTPWLYFTSFRDPEFAHLVTEGRTSEFALHGWSAASVPDPQAQRTFERSRLDWAEPSEQPHAVLLDWYRDLIALRAAEPDLRDPWLAAVHVTYDVAARWLVVVRGVFRVVVNLGAEEKLVPLDVLAVEVVLASSDTAVVEGGMLLAAASAAIVSTERVASGLPSVFRS